MGGNKTSAHVVSFSTPMRTSGFQNITHLAWFTSFTLMAWCFLVRWCFLLNGVVVDGDVLEVDGSMVLCCR